MATNPHPVHVVRYEDFTRIMEKWMKDLYNKRTFKEDRERFSGNLSDKELSDHDLEVAVTLAKFHRLKKFLEEATKDCGRLIHRLRFYQNNPPDVKYTKLQNIEKSEISHPANTAQLVTTISSED